MTFSAWAANLKRRRPDLPPSRILILAVAAATLVAAGAFVLMQPSATTPPQAAHQATGQATGTAKPALPVVQAESGILVDAQSGTVLWSKEPDRRLPPASCTKIMTALIVLEHMHDLQRYATVPAIHLPQTVGIGLLPGQRISVEQALHALLIKSANDAALTLAAYIAGDEPAFVRMMNARAQQLGLSNTHFANCRGTPEPGNFSSARDLATLGRFAMRDARFRAIVGTRTATITWPPDHAVVVTSHNRLLRYPWGHGIKTGATSQSGMVLVGAGQPGLVPLIVATMHEPDRDQEERDAVGLLAWGSAQYSSKTLVTAGETVATVPLAGGGHAVLVAAAPVTAIVRTGANVTVRPAVPKRLLRRPAAGTLIGRAGYWVDGIRVGTVILEAAASSASPTPSPGASAAL